MPEAIQKQAKIFRAGTYAGKGKAGADFVVTVDDLKRIAANTPEAPIIFAHDETHERLDFGKVTNLRVEGDELHGTLNLTAAAAPFVEESGLKSLSAGIPFDLSRLQETSFTRRPHIQDMGTFSQECAWFSLEDEKSVRSLESLIATFATFANTRHNTPAGQIALQDMHDAAARNGAVCDRGNTAKMASQHESTAIQKIHDVAAQHGAKCSSGDAPDWARSNYSQSRTPADERKQKPMGFFDRLLGKSDATDAEKAAAKADFHEAVKELIPAPTDNTAQFAEMAKKSDILDAKTFALEMLTAGKILPTQMSTCVAEFADAAEDDRLAPKIVTFSVGDAAKQGTRVDKVRAKYEAAAPHSLTKDLLDGDTALFALANRLTSGKQKTQSEIDAEREAEYNEWHGKPASNGAARH